MIILEGLTNCSLFLYSLSEHDRVTAIAITIIGRVEKKVSLLISLLNYLH